jgi:hypothetical protein
MTNKLCGEDVCDVSVAPLVEGFDYTFEPVNDSITVNKTNDGYDVRYLTYDTSPAGPDAWADDNIFLVHYHRKFDVRRDDVIKENDIANWYRGDFSDYDGGKFPFKKEYHIFPVSAYIHSGVCLYLGKNESPYDAGGWDTSHVGAVLVSKKEWKSKDKAYRAAGSLIEEWNQYLSGDVYCIVKEEYDLDKKHAGYDVISGYYGEKYALEALKSEF